MLYALICTDKPHSEEVRLQHRPAHREFLASLGDRLKFAGPFLCDNLTTATGSLIVVEASNRDEALLVANEDPYAAADLFESVEIRPWDWVFNNPEK
ncbi:YciI family protein [Polycladidibacter hongkongensis]|uniref:YciI family protein n=1 Tax=Polycladidibacter hongkongensis TaxID=1647556 RepID=UPI00082CF827|nr:YciI family protein [Pseudovibrio hongkongensis]